jgi:hypothetical protein
MRLSNSRGAPDKQLAFTFGIEGGKRYGEVVHLNPMLALGATGLG